MSVSLLVDGKLWGLVSCVHHAGAHFVAPRRRETCETIGRIVSLQIGALQARDLERSRGESAGDIRRLAEAMRAALSRPLAAMASQGEALLAVVGASGAAIVEDGATATVGECPADSELAALAAWATARSVDGGVVATSQLGIDEPAWSHLAGIASGVMAFALPAPRDSCVLWFRPEEVATVTWGGDPRKPAEVDTRVGALRLHPRKSFEAWKERVRNRARRWTRADMIAAEALRRYAIEADLVVQVAKERKALQARDDLVAVVSHDLRSPMSVVVMQATLMQHLLNEAPAEASQRLLRSADTIQRAGQRMVALLNDLLDLAKIEAGRYKVSPTRQPAALLLREAVELLHSVAEARGVSLAIEGDDADVAAEPERIFQVFSNLIGNAVKFSRSGGVVRLGLRTVEGYCEFHVADQGEGIAPEAQDHIFERYWQARPSEAAGAGLGLYITKGIVEAHGGRIRVESAPGLGAKFLFTLPLWDSSRKPD